MRILVVEDEEKVARFVERGLKSELYAVDVAPDGATAFIAALDGVPGPLAALAGVPGDIRRVATMGETLPQGGSIGRFALNGVAVAGPGGALTFATVAQKEGERNAIYCRCPASAR